MTDILIIDDDLGEFLPGLRQALKQYRLHFAYSGRDGLELLRTNPQIALVLLDIKMPPDFAQVDTREGVEVLKRLKKERPDVPAIMLTVLTDVDLVVESIQAGAFHYITKPIDRDKLRDTVKRALATSELEQEVRSLSHARDAVLRLHTNRGGPERDAFHGLIGAHPLMQQLYDEIETVAPIPDVKVLFLGETGSGKNVAARALHACSPRRNKPFGELSCTTLATEVAESELFGHTAGAYTGATHARKGLFVAADGGTLFLDEIGDLPLELQAKLLRVLESQELKPVGSDESIKVDVRLVCATHRDLQRERDQGTFRKDLYNRVWDVPITLPPLRARKEDIPALTHHFCEECAAKSNLHAAFDSEAVACLAEYDWPGNVRELAVTVRRLLIFAKAGRVTENQVCEALGLTPRPRAVQAPRPEAPPAAPEQPSPAAEPVVEPSSVREPGEDAYPDLADMNEYRRLHGDLKLKQVLVRAIREGGGARQAMALLNVPDERYDSFRKALQRLGISIRESRS